MEKTSTDAKTDSCIEIMGLKANLSLRSVLVPQRLICFSKHKILIIVTVCPHSVGN